MRNQWELRFLLQRRNLWRNWWNFVEVSNSLNWNYRKWKALGVWKRLVSWFANWRKSKLILNSQNFIIKKRKSDLKGQIFLIIRSFWWNFCWFFLYFWFFGKIFGKFLINLFYSILFWIIINFYQIWQSKIYGYNWSAFLWSSS